MSTCPLSLHTSCRFVCTVETRVDCSADIYIMASLGPRPFLLIQKGKEERKEKGSGKPSRPSSGNGRNVGVVRMECNYYNYDVAAVLRDHEE